MDEIIQLEKKYILQTYRRFPVVFKKAKGKYLWDINNKRYLDFFSGLSVCNLGHNHPQIIKAITNQTEKLIHTSNLYYTPPQIKLAEILIKKSFQRGKVFFSNSGAEANECAIKLSRKYGEKSNRYEIISFSNSFHGRTLATLALTGQKKFHKGFNPLPIGFRYATFNDINSVKKLINKKTVAIFIEPVQGEGGVYPANREFLKQLRKLCDENDLLLIFDEIQCGLGRLGTIFAYQHFNVKPDVITIAKSLAGGLPLGATIVDKKYSNLLTYGEHGSTFGGNPVCCAAACAYINLLTPHLLNHVRTISNYFINCLAQLKNKYTLIREIRGVGLMLGIELKMDVYKIVLDCLKEGIIINNAKKEVIRLLPPFIINKSDVDFFIHTFSKILSKYS